MEWISFKDKAPYIYDFVLVFADNKGTGEPKPMAIARIVNMIGTWEFLGEGGVGAWMDIEYSMEREDITHWMPLPKPPEGA